MIDNDNCGTAAAHAWNELEGAHFDITATLWTNDDHTQVKSVHYFPNISNEGHQLVHPDLFKFDAATCKDVEDINGLITLQATNAKRSGTE